MSRPPGGFGHYLRDTTYGALDGVITTMAVLAGSQGASLSPRVGLILGFANLIGDGISMGASNYLGMRSEIEQAGGSIPAEAPWRHGLATTAAFVIVGAVPLLGFPLSAGTGWPLLPASAVAAATALMAAGGVRATFVRKSVLRSAIEMLSVGTLAGLAAYFVGRLAASLL